MFPKNSDVLAVVSPYFWVGVRGDRCWAAKPGRTCCQRGNFGENVTLLLCGERNTYAQVQSEQLLYRYREPLRWASSELLLRSTCFSQLLSNSANPHLLSPKNPLTRTPPTGLSPPLSSADHSSAACSA